MRHFFALIILSCATALIAQQPTIVHARLTTETPTSGLAGEVATLEKSSEPVWVGYTIPTVTEFNGNWGNTRVAYLERNDSYGQITGDHLTPNHHAVLLMRVSGGKVERLRAESPEQTIDAGDLRFVWLPNVTPEDSIGVLRSIALMPANKQINDSAVFFISLHASNSAVPALTALAAPSNDITLRERACFWLANQRGHEGFEAIRKLTHEDLDARFREKLTFDLTLSHDAGALDELIRMAREDASPKVRAQAQFWMAQTAAKRTHDDAARIATSLGQLAETDPDAAARRQAVFAVSRLPADRAVAELTGLASNSKHPEVREQAVFWLGQSHDPRALDYLAKLLK